MSRLWLGSQLKTQSVVPRSSVEDSCLVDNKYSEAVWSEFEFAETYVCLIYNIRIQSLDVDVEDVLAQAMCLFASFSSTNDQNML